MVELHNRAADQQTLLDDLRAEGDALDDLVADLPADRWTVATPAKGWTIAHQIGHLLWTDRAALTAIRDPEAFRAGVLEAFTDPLGFVDAGAAELAQLPAADLLADWRAARHELAHALAEVPQGTKIIWYGPPMSAASMATARLMETWAHGGDVADALGVVRAPTARLRHIAHLGVRTRDFAYIIRDATPPAEPFRVALTAPDGSEWTWGPEDAQQSVTGPALDFCSLVTQRVHRDDTALVATGSDADEWLGFAQAFAGPPGPGRAPGEAVP
ncbi:TIGR03084 family protein [Rhodococcus sp. BL-253-APC-6A1W]|uniref:TIGR03084 family metal-binding protein n=1 Tax=Rhodococcus sp. BL-253-APC-6A1W TaxID=2725307 RepID=UPI00146DA526|nr:TIGR03084 family metal-binding protein [Rhodococcus sp. BL-253-APC-6A1W]NMD94224.1 TIGR03084 family protein [Rhodococcus sp. BL-253-APC-6A1W]